MAINFDLFKYIATDPTTAAFAGGLTYLDYASQKAAYDKNKDYILFKKKVLDQQKVAEENGVIFNTYLSNQVVKQDTQEAVNRQKQVSAQSVNQGAIIGQEGSAAELVARDAAFQRAATEGKGAQAIARNTAQAQLQLDNINLQYSNSVANLDYNLDNLESPSIFSAITNTTLLVDQSIKSAEQSRANEERSLAGEDIITEDTSVVTGATQLQQGETQTSSTGVLTPAQLNQ